MSLKICLILSFFLSFGLLGQQPGDNKKKVDSLLKIVGQNKGDLDEATALLELSEVYSMIDLDSVDYYALKAEELALKIQSKDDEQSRDVQSIVASSNNNRGFASFNKGDFPNALKYHKSALDVWKKMNDNDGIGKSLNNLGVVYRQLGDFKNAEKFFKDALKVYEKKKDNETLALIHNNLGGTYKMLGKDDLAIKSYRVALHLRKKIGDHRGVATTLNNIGAFYKKHEQYDSAYFYFKQSLELIEKVGDQIGIAHASSNIGEMAIIQNDLPKAATMGEKALGIGRELGANIIIEQASGLLERVYQLQGNWRKAYEMQKLFHETTLKIKGEEARNAAMKMEMQYEFDKQKEIDRIRNEKQQVLTENKAYVQKVSIYFMSILILLASIFTFIIYRRYKIILHQKEIIEKQNNERKTMLQEIHHRVKNNFQIISSMLRLQTHNKPNEDVKTAFDEAINRIHTMSTVHEIIYRQETLDKVDPREYLENLVANLSRSFETGNITIKVDSCEDPLELDQTIPLGIIVNELITNSFKHAFNQDIIQPAISISLKKQNGKFILSYRDNGVGYKPTKHDNSFGLELIETMVHQIAGKMEFMSENEWPTKFEITF